MIIILTIWQTMGINMMAKAALASTSHRTPATVATTTTTIFGVTENMVYIYQTRTTLYESSVVCVRACMMKTIAQHHFLSKNY